MGEELYGVVTGLGLLAVESLLQQDVEALCGPRYSRSRLRRRRAGRSPAARDDRGGEQMKYPP